jgi:hypothetical protein
MVAIFKSSTERFENNSGDALSSSIPVHPFVPHSTSASR